MNQKATDSFELSFQSLSLNNFTTKVLNARPIPNPVYYLHITANKTISSFSTFHNHFPFLQSTTTFFTCLHLLQINGIYCFLLNFIRHYCRVSESKKNNRKPNLPQNQFLFVFNHSSLSIEPVKKKLVQHTSPIFYVFRVFSHIKKVKKCKSKAGKISQLEPKTAPTRKAARVILLFV